MHTAKILKAIRENAWSAILTEDAEVERIRRGLSITDVRRALLTARAVRQEGDGWRVTGGAATPHGETIEPLVIGNLGILVIEL
jgi:hypothetical protein